MVNFSVVWTRIERHAGETFHQRRGGEFAYSIRSGCLLPDRTNRQIPRSNFEKAFESVPLQETVALQSFTRPIIYLCCSHGRPNSRGRLVAGSESPSDLLVFEMADGEGGSGHTSPSGRNVPVWQAEPGHRRHSGSTSFPGDAPGSAGRRARYFI